MDGGGGGMGVLFVRGKAGWGLSSRINWIISWSWSLLSSGWGGWRTGPCAAPVPGGWGALLGREIHVRHGLVPGTPYT